MRLEGHDYRLPRWYFITANTWKSNCWFGTIRGGQMHLNRPGRIVDDEWHRSEVLRDNVALDAFVVMPDHVHGIIRLRNPWFCGVEMPSGPTQKIVPERAFGTSVPDSLSTIVGSFKAAVTRRVHRIDGWEHRRVWQSRFDDPIIRNQRELQIKRRYIHTNPARGNGSCE